MQRDLCKATNIVRTMRTAKGERPTKRRMRLELEGLTSSTVRARLDAKPCCRRLVSPRRAAVSYAAFGREWKAGYQTVGTAGKPSRIEANTEYGLDPALARTRSSSWCLNRNRPFPRTRTTLRSLMGEYYTNPG